MKSDGRWSSSREKKNAIETNLRLVMNPNRDIASGERGIRHPMMPALRLIIYPRRSAANVPSISGVDPA